MSHFRGFLDFFFFNSHERFLSLSTDSESDNWAKKYQMISMLERTLEASLIFHHLMAV